MFGFLRSRWFWIIAVLAVVIVGGGLFMKGQAETKKKKVEAAAAQQAPSPYAAIANGKADVEGGMIQVAARR
ncbi:MAG TPA: hemolysin secretion protein D, partial [Caulobacter sp.]|nr:hemolysin secretion protein D [Caulobacter sp.]